MPTYESKPFQCQYCPKTYPTKNQLDDHVAGSHWKILHPEKHGRPGKKKVR